MARPRSLEVIELTETLAETLKYLYLLFSDDNALRFVVFNTEGHPLRVNARGSSPVRSHPQSTSDTSRLRR
ncbi:MAG: hypothetical protein DMF59_13200 [Acidobacteria bacterium]|nr:MAG: hypothetical protein DMF59_13200 [Acidobacteriota bacterium]